MSSTILPSTSQYSNSGTYVPTILKRVEYGIDSLSKLSDVLNENGKKIAHRSSDIGSSAVILDATLSLFTPNRLWLSTGIRALDHCVEQQYRSSAPLPVRALAREAAGTLFESLRACHKNEKDVEARQRALIGAWLSLWSDDRITYLGPSHSIGYQLGAPFGIPHGICSCLTLAPSHKCSSTTAMVRQFSHIPTSDTSLFAAHHEKFSFSLFAPLPSNPTNPGEIPSSNLLASSLISNPPLKRF
ncbi:unnamed protein product [Rotaria sordida]|uniref:Fe-containing alcohol dehydrogenase-like C-terminal domain-containing protein n=1 Tax=Rotaria sordida TaxID=392033 RepID=A0A814JRF6_9BILA|nr:unnamed protein product [Rotaria sordida]